MNLLQGELGVFDASIKRRRNLIGIRAPLAVFENGHAHGAINMEHAARLFIEWRGVDCH